MRRAQWSLHKEPPHPCIQDERLAIPRDREGEFVTKVFKCYVRMMGDMEEAILESAYLGYLRCPVSHDARLRATNMLERLFKEIKRRTRVVGVFPNETSVSTLTTEIILSSSEGKDTHVLD